MTAERLKEITERVTNATPGPWTLTKPEYKDGWPQGIVIGGVVGKTTIYGPLGGSAPYNDAKFMAAARQDIPDLLAHIQALEDALRDGKRLVRDVLSEFYSHRYVVAGAMPTDGSCDTRWMRDAEKWIEASAALSPAPATKGQP